MGVCLELLTEGDRDRIARAILEDCKASGGSKVWAHCPFHQEGTKGGSFFYDAATDHAFCYSCNGGGDLIDVFGAVRGLAPDDPEAFKSFRDLYLPRQEGKRGPKGRARSEEGGSGGLGAVCVPEDKPWEPSPVRFPDNVAADVWRERAGAFVDECHQALMRDGKALSLLQGRWGVSEDTARACRIGFNGKDAFKVQKSWGLPADKNANGRDACIHLPTGFVFPVFDADGTLLRAKIRLEQPKDGEPSYKAIKGGAVNAYALFGDRDSRYWVVVETERDGMMLWQELAAYGFGSMAIGTAKLTPDAEAHRILSRAEIVIDGKDNDAPGARASWTLGYSPRSFSWNQTYAHAIRWPVPASVGKDAGNLFKSGITPWEWISAALPDNVARRCEKMKSLARTDEVEL